MSWIISVYIMFLLPFISKQFTENLVQFLSQWLWYFEKYHSVTAVSVVYWDALSEQWAYIDWYKMCSLKSSTAQKLQASRCEKMHQHMKHCCECESQLVAEVHWHCTGDPCGFTDILGSFMAGLQHTHTTVFWSFVWVYPGEPVPEETFIHSHPSCSLTILISFLHLPRTIIPAQSTYLTITYFNTCLLYTSDAADE